MSIQSISSHYINMLPNSNSGEEMPTPQFLIVNQPIAKWNGLCIFSDGISVIKLQKQITKDEDTLRRVIAHEICHAWAFWKCYILKEFPSNQASDHSSMSAWYKAAKMINSHEGPDFVTEKSDSTYVQIGERSFWVFLERNKMGLMWSWFPNPTDEVERVLRYRVTHCDMHGFACTIVKTNDERYLIPESKLPHIGKFADVPDDMADAITQAIRSNPITPDSPRDIKTLITQARVI